MNSCIFHFSDHFTSFINEIIMYTFVSEKQSNSTGGCETKKQTVYGTDEGDVIGMCNFQFDIPRL